MRRFSSSWDKTLTALGFRRNVKRIKHDHYRRKHGRIERLEQRAMLAADFISHWNFDDAPGAIVAADISVQGYDGVLPGGTFSSTEGQIQGALSLNGSNEYVDVSNAGHQILGSSDFTVSGWFKASGIDNKHQTIFAVNEKTGSNSGNNKFMLFLGRTTNSTNSYNNRIAIFDESVTPNHWSAPSSAVLGDNEWHHVTVTRNGNDISLYADGVIQLTYNNSNSVSFDADDYWSIGQEYDPGGKTDFLTGKVDDFRVYDRALSQEEILQLRLASYVKDGLITVSALTDTVDGNYSAGNLSLREAIEIANILPGDNTITFDPNVFDTAQTITLTDYLGLDDLNNNGDAIAIEGPGADLLTIDGGAVSGTLFGEDMVFFVDATAIATISGISITGGKLAGILSLGDLTLDQVEVSDNVGYGILSAQTFSDLTITRSTIAGNELGGIRAYYGGFDIANTTISGNEGVGGVEFLSISSNTGILTNVTITDNQGDSVFSGGVNAQGPGSLTINNSILIDNTNNQGISDIAPDAGIIGLETIFSGINNLIGESNDSGLSDGDTVADADLLSLDYYGGPTRTHALDVNSTAIDAGDNTAASGFTTDQRGIARIADGGVNGLTVDIGATEHASSVAVNTTSDIIDGADGVTSLREALTLAQAAPGDNTITFDPNVFDTAQTITLTDQGIDGTPDELLIDDLNDNGDELTIVGPGADLLTIDGGGITGTLFGADNVFSIDPTVIAMISGLTVAKAKSAGISNQGELTLDQVEVSGNIGYGIFSTGSDSDLTVTRSTIADNEYGGLRAYDADINLSNTTISGNEENGGIEFISPADTASGTLTNVTITDNQDYGLLAFGGSLEIVNSILVGNTDELGLANDVAPDAGVSGYLTDYSGSTNNLIGESNDSGLSDGDTVADADLLSLDYYGGPTRTHALDVNSTAIDAGDNTAASGFTTDQRGIGFARQQGGTVDIGAYESMALMGVVASMDDEQNVVIQGSTNGDTITVFNDSIVIDGLSGSPILLDIANANSILIFAGEGNDIITVDPSVTQSIWVDGGEGNDTISTGSGDDYVDGGAGDDILSGNAGHDAFFGGLGNDNITGGTGDDRLNGGEDNDYLYGESGDDFLIGAEGVDEIFGGLDNDTILGGEGNDSVLSGGEGNDLINGEGGNDNILGGNGTDTINGGDGDDTLLGGDGVDELNGGAGLDVFEVLSASEDYLDDILHDPDGETSITSGGVTNSRPFFTSTPSAKSLVVGEESSLTFEADPGEAGQTIIYSNAGDPLPTGATFVNGVFTWTPTAADEGTVYSLMIRATDGGATPLSVIHAVDITVHFSGLPSVESFVSVPDFYWQDDDRVHQKFVWNLPTADDSYKNFNWTIEERLSSDLNSTPWRVVFNDTISNNVGTYLERLRINQEELDYYGEGNFLGQEFDYRIKYTDPLSGASSSYTYTTGILNPGSADIFFGDQLRGIVDEFPLTPINQIVMDYFTSPGDNPVTPDYYVIQELTNDAWNTIEVLDSSISSAYTETRPQSLYPDGWRVMAKSGQSSYILGAIYNVHESISLSSGNSYVGQRGIIPIPQGWSGNEAGFFIGSNNDYDSWKYDELPANEAIINRPLINGMPVVDSVPNNDNRVLISTRGHYDNDLYPIIGSTGLYWANEASFDFSSGINLVERTISTSNDTDLGTQIADGGTIMNPSAPIYVQGLQPSNTKGDQSLDIEIHFGSDPITNSYTFTVVDIDLEISGLDNYQEFKTGAIIQTNSDFSKGLEEDGAAVSDNRKDPDTEEWVYDANNTEVMTPATLTWNANVHQDLSIILTYPDDVLVWSIHSDGSGASVIESGVPFSSADNGLDLMIEGLERSTSFATTSIEAKFVDPNNLLSIVDTDEAKYTVVDFYAAVDGDRDGTISSTSKGDRQLTWWYNNDSDAAIGPDETTGESYLGEDIDSSLNNSQTYGIDTTRDLEDFAPLNIYFDPLLVALEQNSDLTFEIVAHLTSDIDDDATAGESITLHKSDTSTVDSKFHITNTTYADSLVKSSRGGAIGSGTGSNQSSINKNSYGLESGKLKNIVEDLNSFVLEASHVNHAEKQTTETELVFTLQVKNDGQLVQEIPTNVRLHIKEIEDFYSTYKIENIVGGNDLRKDLSAAALHHPNAVEVNPSAIWDTSTNPDHAYLADGDNFVWVHGWNLTPEWKEIFSDTTFKRMYWEGFKGKFYEFSWPTFYDEEGPLFSNFSGFGSNNTYNPSEFQAYRSGESLKNFLSGLGGDTHVFAHSMGNVVVAEALRQHSVVDTISPLVKSYVSFASAFSAGAYGQDKDSNTTAFDATGQVFLSNTNNYDPTVDLSNGSLDESDYDLLRYWSTSGEKPIGSGAGGYYMEGAKSASSKWISLYNEEDYATSFAWRVNNYNKSFSTNVPPSLPDYLDAVGSRLVDPEDLIHHPEIWSSHYYNVDEDTFDPRRLLRLLYDEAGEFGYFLNGTHLEDEIYSGSPGSAPGLHAYEVLAFLSQSNVATVGSIKLMNGWFDAQVDVGMDLMLTVPNGFNSKHNHSLHIRHDAKTTRDFWKSVINEMGVTTSLDE